MIDDADRAGTTSQMPVAVSTIMTKVFGNNYSNMTKEERQNVWDHKFALPSTKSSDYDYYDKIRGAKEIEQIKDSIKQVVDAIEQKMDEDCKMWQVSPEIRHLSSLRTHRGQMRFLKQGA